MPSVLRVTALFLLLGGVLAFMSAFSGISGWQPPRVEYFSSGEARAAIGFYGAFVLALAFGVYRRQEWAWHLLLIFIGATGLWSFVHTLMSNQFPEFPPFPHSGILRIVFAVATLAVTGYWGWWWYAQRVHFQSNTG